MILIETLEDLIQSYLKDPARPGSALGKVNAHDLAAHIAQHLAQRGVEIGFGDGSRFTFPRNTPSQPDPERHRLPLVLQQRRRGEIRIYCDGRDCFWSWPLRPGAAAQTNGEAITNAILHAIRRHGRNSPSS